MPTVLAEIERRAEHADHGRSQEQVDIGYLETEHRAHVAGRQHEYGENDRDRQAELNHRETDQWSGGDIADAFPQFIEDVGVHVVGLVRPRMQVGLDEKDQPGGQQEESGRDPVGRILT